MRRARLQSLGLAYLSPQNKSLAQSFRYMRNKPTIIAFKAPKVENSEPEVTETNGNAIRQTYMPALEVKEGKKHGEEKANITIKKQLP